MRSGGWEEVGAWEVKLASFGPFSDCILWGLIRVQDGSRLIAEESNRDIRGGIESVRAMCFQLIRHYTPTSPSSSYTNLT